MSAEIKESSLSPVQIDLINKETSEADANSFINNPKLLKKDILLFKDDVLKDLKLFMRQISEKVNNDEKFVKEKIEKFNINIQNYSEKIHELSNLICTDKTIRDKVESVVNFKQKAQESLMTNDIKINNLDKDVHDNIYRIDNILKDTVLYPGIIGGICKFKTFHDLIDFILSEISQMITFKEKNNIDINAYKTKVDNITQMLEIKIENHNRTSTKYLQKCIKNMEEKFQSLLDLYDEKLTVVRMENTKYIEEIKKATKKLMDETNNVLLMKRDIMKKFNDEVKFLKNDNVRVIKCFSGYKEDFFKMRKKFIELSEFIRDVRFKVNLGEELKTSDFRNLSRRIAVSPNVRKKRMSIIDECDELIQCKRKNTQKIRRATIMTPNSFYNILNEEEFDRKRNSVLKSIYEMENESTANNVSGEKKEYENFLKNYLKNDELKKTLPKKSSKKNNEDKVCRRHHRKRHKNKNKNIKKNKKRPTLQLFHYLKLEPLTEKEKIPEFQGRQGKFRKTLKIDTDNIFKRINNKKHIFPLLSKEDIENESYSSISESSSESSNSSNSSSSSSSEYSLYSSKTEKKEKKEKKEKNNNENIKEDKEYKEDKEEKKILTIPADFKNTFNVNNKIKLKNDDLSIDLDNNNNINVQMSDDFNDIKNGNIKNNNLVNSCKIINNNNSINNYMSKMPNLQAITENTKLFKKQNSALIENKFTVQTQRNKHIKNIKSQEDTIKQISLTVDGANKVVLHPLKNNNDKITLNVVKNVQEILDKNKKLIPNKTYSGLPKIVSNQGERIIVAAHPVFHSKKFSPYTSPNVIALNHSIQALYGKKLQKKNNKKQNYSESVNGSGIKIVGYSQSEKKNLSNNFFMRTNKNSQQINDLGEFLNLNIISKQSAISKNRNKIKIIEKNDNIFESSTDRNKNLYKTIDGNKIKKDDGGKNRYYNLMVIDDKKIP